jgi:hypothetical protein
VARPWQNKIGPSAGDEQHYLTSPKSWRHKFVEVIIFVLLLRLLPLMLILELKRMGIQASYALELTDDAAVVAQQNFAITCLSAFSLVTREQLEHAVGSDDSTLVLFTATLPSDAQISDTGSVAQKARIATGITYVARWTATKPNVGLGRFQMGNYQPERLVPTARPLEWLHLGGHPPERLDLALVKHIVGKVRILDHNDVAGVDADAARGEWAATNPRG